MKKMELDAALDRFLKEEDAEEYFWPDQMAGNRNIIVINVGLIQKSSEDLADEFRSAASHASDGIVMTIVHELRHLMLETNVLLPEEKYPDYEVTEAAVEEYTRQFADRWLLGNSVFVNRG